jgi:thiol-disulfide isomerase/thioredoxin
VSDYSGAAPGRPLRRPVVWALFAIAAVAALGAGTYFGGRYLHGDENDPGRNAALLMQLSLPDVNGTPQSLDQWRGKVLIVNFWATWCVPCREEMPEFVRTQQEFGDKGLQFVGVAVDEQGKVARFADEIALNYPALIGGYGAMELSKTLGNRLMALPFTVIVGRDGNIAFTQLGPIKKEQLLQIVTKLL